MTTSPQQPGADAVEAVDPLIVLDAEHRAANAAFNEANAAHDEAEGAFFKTPHPDYGTPEDVAARAEAGLTALKDAADAAQKPVVSLLDKIIATPAVSLAGVAVKLRQAAYWIEVGCEGPEQELIPSALQDVERLAGEAGVDPLPALYARWHALEWKKSPEGLTADESDRFTDGAADEADAVAVEIIAAPATTLTGAYAQIALLKYWADNSVPDRADAALSRLHSSIKSALQGAAAVRTESTDPVMHLVQTLPALFDEQGRLEIKELKQRRGPDSSEKYCDLIQATERVIAQTTATSLQGALAQIAIANHLVHEIEDWVEDEAHQDRAKDARALLHSAVSAIEAATGARRPEVTARWHMIDAHNPQIAREAVKAGVA